MAKVRIELELSDDEQEVAAYHAGKDWLYTKVAAALAVAAKEAERSRHLVTVDNWDIVAGLYENDDGEGIDADTEVALFRYLKFEEPGLWPAWRRKYPVRVALLSLRGALVQEDACWTTQQRLLRRHLRSGRC